MAYKLAYDLGWNAAANDQSARCPDGLDSDGWIDGYCDYIWSLIRKAMK